MNINALDLLAGAYSWARFVLFGFRTNLVSHFARSPLSHSYGYGSAADRTLCKDVPVPREAGSRERPNCLARFGLTNSPGANLNNRRLARKGEGQDVRSNPEPFVEYAG
jgi:hypothetical protein